MQTLGELIEKAMTDWGESRWTGQSQPEYIAAAVLKRIEEQGYVKIEPCPGCKIDYARVHEMGCTS